MAIFSSAAVNLPLFLMIPPTFPSPSSKSVFSSNTTSAPAFLADRAAAHPDHPPPITTTLYKRIPPNTIFIHLIWIAAFLLNFRLPSHHTGLLSFRNVIVAAPFITCVGPLYVSENVVSSAASSMKCAEPAADEPLALVAK